MALGHKSDGGLDISGVGKRKVNLPGGDMKSRSGLQFSGPSPSGGGRHGRRSSGRRGETYVRNSAGAGGSRASRKTLFVIIAVVVGALLLAIAVGALVYQQAVRNALRPNLNDEALSSVLAAPGSTGESSWSVLVKTDADSAETGRGQVEDIALVHTDPEEKSVAFLWLATNTRVYLDGYGYQTLADAFSLQGETGVTASVAKLGSVQVAHYLEFNDAGLRRFVGNLAPIDADPASAGRTALTGALCKKIFGSSSEQMGEIADSIASCAATDMDSEQINGILASLQGVDARSGVSQADEPVKEVDRDGKRYSVAQTDEWTSMIARVQTGMTPVASKREIAQYRAMRRSSTVDIWNGVGVSGIASDCSKELRKLGWNIGKTGNAAQFVYKETLVVYNSPSKRSLAALVVSDLGQGRAVAGAARYAFSGDVLVVLGSDYRPY